LVINLIRALLSIIIAYVYQPAFSDVDLFLFLTSLDKISALI
jgi:hypothetical protein